MTSGSAATLCFYWGAPLSFVHNSEEDTYVAGTESRKDRVSGLK